MGRLLSVNVGLPRDIMWQGRTVHTAVWKHAVQGRRRVRRLNIDGDGQGDLAGHGGEHRAVFVYQAESYDYWQRQLGRNDIIYGMFGENFTVEGLSDDEVRIGDRYQIGSALFEVTQPRVTCYRVGIRMNEPRLPTLLVAHGRPGFYFRVLQEGEVESGDEIVQVSQDPNGMTVSQVDALLYKPGHPMGLLEKALRIPALSAGWRSSFKALADQAVSTAAPSAKPDQGAIARPALAWPGFRSLRVAAKTLESESVTSVMLEPDDGRPLVPGLPGQFVVLRLSPIPDAPPLIRSYSLSGEPSSACYRISVKKNPGGMAGTFIHDEVRIGDIVDAAAPRGSFVLKADDGPIILLSAGIGATPLLAMLHVLAGTRAQRETWWIHAARDGSEHPFAKEVDACLERLPQAHRHIRYSSPRPADRLAINFDAPGRIDVSVLAELGVPLAGVFYLCGPPSFMTGLTLGLTGWGVATDRIYSELFGTRPALTPGIRSTAPRPPHLPATAVGTGPIVSFARSGLNVHWSQSFQSLLELAEACDVPVRWACRSGVCHNCETALVAGDIDYQVNPIDPPAVGNILICCSQPTSDIVIDL
jgi:ferredoxin-NADP reductase/MOSC domain-containing protein YiiM